MDLVVEQRFAGPPSMGHGGYVAGLFAVGIGGGRPGTPPRPPPPHPPPPPARPRDRPGGAAQAPPRPPTPLDQPLHLARHDDGRGELRHGDELIAEAEPSTLTLAVPSPPGVDDAAAAEAGSPSHRNGLGVHPVCFGCGINRIEGDALRIAAGPVEVDGIAQVAAAWRPGPTFAGPDGDV